MVNEFKLTMHHRSFCTPKPDADLCMRVDLKTRQKTVENQGRLFEKLYVKARLNT